ncbi:hypothetical protein [Streptomyces sp. NPDC019507]|uniref:hypothetical protein n=1 Tax=Streptomyces sp. NPDC019507 TaxID=3154689 RepID=UPI0033F6C7B5
MPFGAGHERIGPPWLSLAGEDPGANVRAAAGSGNGRRAAGDIAMFRADHTTEAPWTVLKSNDKRRARLEAIRHPPTCADHAREDPAATGTPDPLVIAAADTLLEPAEEDTTLAPIPPAQDPHRPGTAPARQRRATKSRT